MEEELPGDQVCPQGHPAVTCRVEYPVDDVQVLISPAARVVDAEKGQRTLNDRFYLSLLDKTGAEVLSSREHFDWDEALKLATFFKGKSIEQARSWWTRRSL
jgi:hypothetical protein